MWDGFFHMDDFFYLADADRPFVDYVFQVYNGHLMPGEFALVWWSQAIAPMSWPLAVAITGVMWGALLSGIVFLVRDLFGNSRWGLVTLTLVAFAPLMTTVTVWYASALQILPWATSFVWMLYFASRHARHPNVRWLVLTVLAFAAGLVFWEKTLLALPVVLWVWWRYWPGTGRLGLRGLGVRWWLPALTVGLAALYSLIYLSVQPENVLRSEPSAGQLVDSVRISLAEVWIPAHFGAPWTGFGEGLVPGTSSSWWLFAITLQIAVAAVVISVLRWRAALNAWLVMGGYALVTVALFAFGRINAFGLALAYDPRYVEDLFIVSAVVLPFAFVRPAGSPLPMPRRLNWLPGQVPIWLQVLGFAAFVNVLLLPSIAVGTSWHDSAAKSYVAAARESLDRNPESAVLDVKVPGSVMAPLFLERANASYVLAGARLPVRWNGAGERLLVLDEQGRARPVSLAASSTSVPGFDGECGYRVFGTATPVELDTTLFDWTWIVRMDYLAGGSGDALASLDGNPVQVPIKQGLGTVEFVVVGGGDTLTVTPPQDVGLCVTRVVVGQDGPT